MPKWVAFRAGQLRIWDSLQKLSHGNISLKAPNQLIRQQTNCILKLVQLMLKFFNLLGSLISVNILMKNIKGTWRGKNFPKIIIFRKKYIFLFLRKNLRMRNCMWKCIRQGGIMSPYLYNNNVLKAQEKVMMSDIFRYLELFSLIMLMIF